MNFRIKSGRTNGGKEIIQRKRNGIRSCKMKVSLNMYFIYKTKMFDSCAMYN